MTPQDKSFITRIQLQQLVTATGTVDAVGPESLLNEDFYYQVYAQIRGAPRQNPHQPANQFAQTYLFQTGGRYGHGRRHPRGGENHMQRMEQQVQRAVEAARAKPKNSQLVIEGSLGKISFSNAKTPKPLLNIKRPEGDLRPNSAPKRSSRHHDATAERRETLKNIENVYGILMETEDIMRQEPREAGSAYDEWASRYGDCRERLWKGIKADVPLSEK
jgi:DNA topoisomerase 2-associated protein PAT1